MKSLMVNIVALFAERNIKNDMFEEILNRHGFELQWHDHELFLFKSETHLIMIYQWQNVTRVDRIENHDRWSVAEYEFDFVPYTEEDWNKIVKEANIN